MNSLLTVYKSLSPTHAHAAGAEFRGQYGNLGNRDFANALSFSESAEHVALTAPRIQSENPGEYLFV